jgi:hypothetical protein
MIMMAMRPVLVSLLLQIDLLLVIRKFLLLLLVLLMTIQLQL